MTVSDVLSPALELEQALGCPFGGDGPLSFAAAMRADEAEAPPAEAFAAIQRLGTWEHLVPVDLGGRLRSFEELLGLVRVLSRRDLVVPVGLGSSLLAAMPVWLWGTDEQRHSVAGRVLDARFGALCVSEDAAGSDLLATTTRASARDGGHVLDGEKWMVGNASRASFMVVLAAAERGLGLFLVDADAAAPAALRRLPRIRTLGLRAHDLGGMTFSACPADGAIGTVGRGMEMIAGALQFTRTMIGGLALGAADTALRVAAGWAAERRLYGAPIAELPPIRRLLAGAYADLLVADCLATAAARGLNLAPKRMPLWAAAAKYAVPWLCEQVVRDCAEILSARHYLREGVAGGIFQKMVRDVAIAAIFEGTQLVQLETVRAQLLHGARLRAPSAAVVDARELFDFGAAVAPWDAARPALAYGGRDEICDGLDAAVEELLAAAPDERGALAAQARRLLDVRERLRRGAAAMAAATPGRAVEGYELARRYCLLLAGASCVHAAARDGGDAPWLPVALERVLERLGEPGAGRLAAAEERCAAQALELEREGRLFSIRPMRLATTKGGA